MYASRGIGRKVYEDRTTRNGKTRSLTSSRGSQSPPIYRSDKTRHDSTERSPLRDEVRVERRYESRDRTPPPRDVDRIERRYDSRDRSPPLRDIDRLERRQELRDRTSPPRDGDRIERRHDSRDKSPPLRDEVRLERRREVRDRTPPLRDGNRIERRYESRDISSSLRDRDRLERRPSSRPRSPERQSEQSHSYPSWMNSNYGSAKVEVSTSSQPQFGLEAKSWTSKVEVSTSSQPQFNSELNRWTPKVEIPTPSQPHFSYESKSWTSKMEISTPSQSQYSLESKPWMRNTSNKIDPDTHLNEMTQQMQKQLEEKAFQEKIAQIFHSINSIDELITLKESYKSKLESLDALLQKSILREGEILRNKRRNRDGYRDPAILENKTLQNDVRKKIDEVNRVMVEVDKKLRAYNKVLLAAKENETDKPSNYEAQLLQNSIISTTGMQEEEEQEEVDEYEATNAKFEYYDPGSHWCRDCDKLIPKIKDYFDHLHTKDHWKFVDNENQLWKKPKKPTDNRISFQSKTKTPIKGAQFLLPIRGFFCPLCSEFLGDNNSAEEHLKSAKHNRIYIRFTALNVDYEHKWNSDKGKALSRHQINEKKRLKEEEQKENEIKRKKEEQRLREEKEAKKRKIEEENRRKEREQSREREYKTNKSESNSNGDKSSDRFRLKGVTVDLNTKKEKERNSLNKLFGKDREDKKNDKEKHNKRKRRFSSSSSSSSSSSAKPVKKKVLPFDDPYKDPKLKMKPYVSLIHLNAKTARKYRCEELLKLIEESKSKKRSEKVSAKLEVDFNVHIEQEFEIKELKSHIDNILKNIDDEEDECIKKSDNNYKNASEDQKQNDTNVSDNSEAPLVIDTTLSESSNRNETDKSDTIKESVPNSNQKTTNSDKNLNNSENIFPNEQIDDFN